MTLRPSRIIEQQRKNPLFAWGDGSNCSACGRELTDPESVAKGIGPVCVRKHYGPGSHPSGSPQSVHAGKRAKRKSLAELSKGKPARVEQLPAGRSGIEISYVVEYTDDTKALAKLNKMGSAESEVMAYAFSESIGWSIVPETVLSPGEPGVSIQRWIEGESPTAPGAHRSFEVGFRKDPRILVMDALLSNYDRHGGNVLVDKGGKQWAIDNNMVANGAARRLDDVTHFTARKKVTKDYAGLIDAAKDVRRWSKTSAYKEYVSRVKELMGGSVAAQFEYNVEDLADWSRKAKVI